MSGFVRLPVFCQPLLRDGSHMHAHACVPSSGIHVTIPEIGRYRIHFLGPRFIWIVLQKAGDS